MMTADNQPAPAVQYLAEPAQFLLTTANTAYVIQRLPDGGLLHLYWGAKLPRPEDYPARPPDWQFASPHSYRYNLLAEFPARAGLQEVEPTLRLTFPDGTRDVRLGYQSHEISPDGQELAIELKDTYYPLTVTLRYRVYPDCDLLARRVEVTNPGHQAVTLEEILSGSVPLPMDRPGQYRLTHLSGAWALETQLSRNPITPGRQVLESRQNFTSHLANPFWAIDITSEEQNGATETAGEIWYGALGWSGNWKIVVEQLHTPWLATRVGAGINDWDFSWNLAPGQTFETPWLTLGYTDQGWGQLSRNLHAYQRGYILPRAFAEELRPVLYNSWEAVAFSVNEAEQLALAEKAAKLGVELFVVDDGWFGERHHDRAGLGDWYTNATKFPNGLDPLVKRVNELGMRFGLWFEPEMVNPDSDLYRQHPDWAYHFPHRESTTSRNQLLLNLARPEVEEFVFDSLDKLLTAHNIGYVKWDYNRIISEPGWPDAPREQQRETWVRHVQALYRIVDRLREKHPQVLFEACASGGGRADLGALSHFDQVWTSDNTDPLDRLSIQQGYSLVYAPKTMFCWVTNWDRLKTGYSLRYRFLSAFMGGLGVGSNLNHWNEAEMEEAAKWVAEYKQVRPLIQHGRFYRLTGLGEAAQMAVEYLAEDGSAGVVLAYQHRHHFWPTRPRLRLRDLEPAALYELSGDLAANEPTQLSGQALMSRGILPRLEANLDAALVSFRRV